MSFDCSRFTFDPVKNYAGVVMPQGRVQLDADWNEWMAQLNRRIQAGTLDTFGRAAYPAAMKNAFKITASNSSGANQVSIGVGRMYVDGLLAENHGILPPAFIVTAVDGVSAPGTYGVQTSVSGGTISFSLFQVTSGGTQQIGGPITGASLSTLQQNVNADPTLKTYIFVENAAAFGQPANLQSNGLYMLAQAGMAYQAVIPLAPALVWDPALAELYAAPTATIDYGQQPYLPMSPPPTLGSGPYLVYLDVWQRPVTYLEDPELIEKALGMDTTGRLQTVWQVKLLDLSQANIANLSCTSDIPAWDDLIQPPAGWLTNGVVPSVDSGPCNLSPDTGYIGMENQLYRVEIHSPGQPLASGAPLPATAGSNIATFKWSRENASIMTAVSAIISVTNSLGYSASQLTVQNLGRDQVLGFSPGDWIELTDDHLELNPPANTNGEFHQIDTVDPVAKTITLQDSVVGAFVPSDPTRHTRIKRWDQSGTVYLSDGKTVYFDGSKGEIPIPPAGTTLILENGITVAFGLTSSTGAFHAGDFWTFAARTADGSVAPLTQAPPAGICHHYARLSVITSFGTAPSDCRIPWPPASDEGCDCCCTSTVGDGNTSFGQYPTIQQAIDGTPDGGEICILPGQYYENVSIKSRNDLVIRGCSWQTRVASAALNPANGAPPPGGGASPPGPETQFAAVISITNSKHIKVTSFIIEAAPAEVGILIDGTGTAVMPPNNNSGGPVIEIAIVDEAAPPGSPVIDTIIKEMIITASTLPAILASTATLLRIEANRIAMLNRISNWPAVYVSGTQILIDHNWVGVLTAENFLDWLPATISNGSTVNPSLIQTVNDLVPKWMMLNRNITRHPGGIQVAGPSQGVMIVENEIDGGSRNGITLGNLEILDASGTSTGQYVGLLVTIDDPCLPGGTLVPPTTPPGNSTTTVVAGGPLTDVQIKRNRISKTGLCGIGPAGLFDLSQKPEIISVTNLTITENTITDSLLGLGATQEGGVSTIGYGAICLPDVVNLTARDNTIENYGSVPGLNVCGIFILHGQTVEISRNHILENRDWTDLTAPASASATDLRGGIAIVMVTPPTFQAAAAPAFLAASNTTVLPCQIGMPALRIEHNTVRVPLGICLVVLGLGPFTVTNNHFGSGGTVAGTGTLLAQTVLILNLGQSLENIEPVYTASAAYGAASNQQSFNFTRESSVPSSGLVLFTNNICQLETRGDGQQSLASVLIFSLDHLLFSNNCCWLDDPDKDVAINAFLLAKTIQVVCNRFQEGVASAGFSAFISGMFNICSQNISTHQLILVGASTDPNVIMV